LERRLQELKYEGLKLILSQPKARQLRPKRRTMCWTNLIGAMLDPKGFLSSIGALP